MKSVIHVTLTLSLFLGLNLNTQANSKVGRNPSPPAAGMIAAPEPDLVIQIAGPQRANPGDDIGQQIRQEAMNRGEFAAPGTVGQIDPANGYMIDLMLSTDASVPEGHARPSSDFAEDMLLKGGRTSRTVDLFPGHRKEYSVGAKIPQNIQPGRYFICARIDSGARVVESDEHNNTACFPIEIGQPGAPADGSGGGPDLVVSEFSLTPANPVQGEPVSVRVGVYNLGNQHTGPFTVQWWAGEGYPGPAQTWFVDGVRARGGKILTFTYNGYPGWYRQIRTIAVVDAGGVIPETEERNNTGILTISVRRP